MDIWYKDAVFYELYVRAFSDSNADGHGDLPGVLNRLDYLKDLGIDCVWLLPLYLSPLRDDGYDISGYYDVLPEYGTLADFRSVVQAIHARGMRIIADLVLNHTSDEHPWFQAARASKDSPFRDYYVWSDTDQKYKDARIIFLDTEKSNWTWDEKAGQYFWHRFYASQPDLNYDNPAVRAEMLKVMSFWLDLGIDGFRADAVPYLFEREGTSCENLPETHAYLKELRRFIEANYPGRVLLCEANQWPEDVRPYFGDGDEFQLGFHFPVMPRIYMALGKGDVTPLVDILGRTPAIPDNCQWCTFLRNHDELTLEMVTEAERQWMWSTYAPLPRQRLNLGIRRRLAPLLDHDLRKAALANSLLFTLPGSPIIYYGDEIGMGDNIWLDDRNGVRTPMQWNSTPGAGFSTAPAEKLYLPLVEDPEFSWQKINVSDQEKDPGSLLNLVKLLIRLRKQQPALATGRMEWAGTGGNLAVAAFFRSLAEEQILVVHNLSGAVQHVQIPVESGPNYLDLVSRRTLAVEQDRLDLHLAPYQFLWLKHS